MNLSPGGGFFGGEGVPFLTPIWSAIAPEVEEKLVLRTIKRTQLDDVKTNQKGSDRKTKNTIRQLTNIKIRSGATQSGLEDSLHHGRRKPELAAAEGDNQEEGASMGEWGDRATELGPDQPLDRLARTGVEGKSLHAEKGTAATGSVFSRGEDGLWRASSLRLFLTFTTVARLRGR